MICKDCTMPIELIDGHWVVLGSGTSGDGLSFCPPDPDHDGPLESHKPDRTAEYAERVRKGAALLDDVAPGWREKIDLSTLDIGDYQQCVLGQLYGTYGEAIPALHPHLASMEQRHSHGFAGVAAMDGFESESRLTRAWLEYLT